MRLGGPLFESVDTPDDWVRALQNNGYRAAKCPVGPDADDDTVRAYESAAQKADIVIAEVGAWSNPLSNDPDTRAQPLRSVFVAGTRRPYRSQFAASTRLVPEGASRGMGLILQISLKKRLR
jgi:hypothetical protein